MERTVNKNKNRRTKGDTQMLSVGARIAMFLSSYFPLGFIYFVQYWNKQNMIALASLGLCLFGLLCLIAILWSSVREVEPMKDRVMQSRLRGDEVMGYIAGYLLPFLAADLTDVRQFISAAVFLGVLGLLYVTTDMLYINPTLYLIGYKVYEVTFESKGVFPVISHKRPRQGDTIQIVRLAQGIFVAKDGF